MGALQGKTALVTGASKATGIGYAIATRLARDGANVVVADLCADLSAEFPGYVRTGTSEELEKLAAVIREHGVRALAVPLDVTDTASVSAVAAAVEKEFGSLNILCNNAGGSPGPQSVQNVEERAWLKTIDINLNGTFRVSKAMIPLLIKGGPGGSIVNTSSRAGKVAGPFMASYCSAKAGVIMLTKVLAKELAGNCIRVNCICPGQIQTDLGQWGWDLRAFSKGMNRERYSEEMKKEIPLGRAGTPEDCANVVAWLVSDQAAYITGQAINVTGGQLMEL
ncbi:MAG TPA: SDR family NAD(P)-dependent oxidoreductase [bacterium]|nr:SDR family NAD(P)-dependent oxidoreductase [bacterium]